MPKYLNDFPIPNMLADLGFRFLVVLGLSAGVVSLVHSANLGDAWTKTTAMFLLASAAVASVLNIARTRRVAQRIAVNQRSVEVHEKALNQHTIVMATDPRGRINSVNQKFTETFGYQADEIIGVATTVLAFDDEAKQTMFQVRKHVLDGNVWSGFHKLRSQSGCFITAQITVFPKIEQTGAVSELVSVITDVSSAMAQSAEKGRNDVVEVLPDGVCIYDPSSFEITYANKVFRRRTGWSADNLDSRSITNLFSESQLSSLYRNLGPLLKGERTQNVFETEDEFGPVEVLTHVVEDMDGKRSLISVMRDITERKQAEDLKLSSVSTVSHELRTPLTSIKGALRLLDSGVMGDMEPNVAKLVNVAHRNSDRLLAIVNDILTLEKLQNGDLSIDPQAVDLRDILSEAAESNAPFAAECNVKFVVLSADEPAFVNADPNRLMQVMSNLMSNAAKLSPEGEAVTLKLCDCEDFWRVSVADNGPGVPEHARDTLFDSFIQVEGLKNKKFASTGLGLTICREIIRQHGGIISFETEVGKGTTFYFELEKLSRDARVMDVPAVA